METTATTSSSSITSPPASASSTMSSSSPGAAATTVTPNVPDKSGVTTSTGGGNANPTAPSSAAPSQSQSPMTCLAGLGAYVERLCALCESGSGLGTLWSQKLEGELVQKLCGVLTDLHCLAQLEATQINMSVEAAKKRGDSTQAVLGCVREFVTLQQQFFQFGAEQLGQLISMDPEDTDHVQAPTSATAKHGRQKQHKAVGSLASQEELDSVIDMLSKSTVQQQQQQQHHQSNKHKQPPSGLPHPSLPPPHPSFPPHHPFLPSRNMFAHPPPPLPPHDLPPPLPPRAPAPNYNASSHVRQSSDSGLAGISTNPEPNKTNTWPFRPRGGAGNGGNSGNNGGQMFGGAAYDGFNTDLEYSQYLEAVKAASGQRSVHRSAQPPPMQAMYNPWNNSQWGADVAQQHGIDGLPRGGAWSSNTGIEESSCSDESSSNNGAVVGGEQWIHRRRHSSGGEKKFAAATAHLPPVPSVLDDDTLLASMEPKSTNTWPPPKQLWSVKPATPPPHSPHQQQQHQQQQQYPAWGPPPELHKPLATQWSDPLQQRSLSVWEPGSFDQLGAVNTSHAAAERKHSLM